MKAEEVLSAALVKKTSAERAAYLDGACGNDAGLRALVEDLLKAHVEAGSFLEQPLFEATPTQGVASSPERPGAVIGPYKLLEQIGEGGFGVVFMAEQTQPIRRKVALKVLKPGMDTRQVVARFEAERQALALMDHPHIADIFDGGETASGRPYFVMELVRGIPMTEFGDQNQLPVRERLALFINVCQAVQHAHQKGIIHRDLKPTNVLVTMHDDKPVAKVIDFGIAKATGQQLTEKTLFTNFAQMIGTPMYMSPEQAQMSGLDVDTRSDIYSLGVLLYELLTGTTPFDKERLRTATYDEIRRIIREEEPPRPSTRFSTLGHAAATVSANRQSDPKRLSQLFRGELDWIVMKALEKDRNRRYETANAFARDVERYLADEPVQACPPSLGYRLRKLVRKNKRTLAMAALLGAMLLVALGAVAGSMGWMMRDQEFRRNRLASQFELILEEVEQRLEKQQWQEALAAARRAEALLAGGGGDPDMMLRVQEVLADLGFVQRLEQIRLEKASEEGSYVWADGAYAAVFKERDLDLDRLAEETAAKRLAWRPQLVVPLAEALDDWTVCRGAARNDAGAQALRAIAQRIDPDPWRRRLREAFAQRTLKPLEELAASPDLMRQQPNTLYLLGMFMCMRNLEPGITRNFEPGIEVLRKGQRKYPGDFWISFQLGFWLAEITPGRRDEGLGFLRAAAAIRPDSPSAWGWVGKSLLAKGETDEAIRCLEKAIEINVSSANAHFDLALALIKVTKLDEAVTHLRKAIDLRPQYGAAYNALGYCLSKQNKLDEAIAACWSALEINPKHPQAAQNLGNAIRTQNDRSKTIAFFTEAIKANEQNAKAHYYLGNALWYQGRVDEALDSFLKAVELAPRDARHQHSLANNLKARNRLDEALVCYETAIELDGKDAWLHVHHGLALHLKGRRGEAIAAWNRAVALETKPERVHAYLAWWLATASDLHLRDPLAAVSHARMAVDLEPSEANHWSNLGVALWRVGDAKAAALALEKADQKWSGGDQFHRFFLAMAYWQVGEKEKARQAFDQGVQWMDKNQPTNEELRRFRAEAAELMDLKKQKD